jgi:hypothetical protein
MLVFERSTLKSIQIILFGKLIYIFILNLGSVVIGVVEVTNYFCVPQIEHEDQRELKIGVATISLCGCARAF